MAIAMRNGVRYSELLRLPYLDIVRMSTTDPMHTFLLGMVRRETELIIDQLDPSQRQEFVRRVKSFKVPYDVGRLPTNIFDHGNGLSGITASQWKLYIITYARPCLYELLPLSAYECLVMLSEIITLISTPVLLRDQIDTLSRLLHKHHQLFTQVYGKWTVTVNYHMSLHLPDTILDLGPPQSFWCFAYERMNGILAGTPNSNRCIEVEVGSRFVQDILFNSSSTHLPSTSISGSIVPHNLRKFVLSDDDNIQVPYQHSFFVLYILSYSYEDKFECQMIVDRGDVDDWPLQFMHPKKRNVRIKAAFLGELLTFFGLYGNKCEYVQPHMVDVLLMDRLFRAISTPQIVAA